MSRTSFLFAMMIVVLLMHYFPARAAVISTAAIIIGVVYLAAFAWRKYPKLYRERKQLAAAQAADERDYQDYRAALEALRTRYDPQQQWELTKQDYPAAYRTELDALHEKYKEMLGRRFGIA